MMSEGPTLIRHRPAPSLRRNLVAGVLALAVALGIGRFAYTPILPAMQGRFDLPNVAAAALASSNNLGYLLGAVFAAFVPPGRPQDVALRAGLWTVMASTVLMGLSADFSGWLVLRFVAGLAGAAVLVLGSAVILDELSRRGRLGLAGIVYSGPGVGITVSGLVVLELNAMFAGDGAEWRVGWLVMGVVAFLLMFACLAWLPKGQDAPQSTGSPREDASSQETVGPTEWMTARAVLALSLLGLAYFLEGAGYIVTGTFLPTIVEGLPGLGGFGAGVWILVGLAAVPSTVLWTLTAARSGAVTALGAAFALQTFGILLPVLSEAWWAAAGSAVLFGGTFTGIAALTLTHARQMAGARGTGLVVGLLTVAYGIGQVIGPLLAAALSVGPAGFGLALLAASAAVAVGGLLVPVVALVGAPGSECELRTPKGASRCLWKPGLRRPSA
jgi:predicted MFS family arabinose efflux permease